MRDAVDLAATVTAGIPTAGVDAPSTAADGNDRFAADEGTETQLRATAPSTSSALTLARSWAASNSVDGLGRCSRPCLAAKAAWARPRLLMPQVRITWHAALGWLRIRT